MKLNNYVHAYRQNSVTTASPGHLIQMLFDGALRFMSQALTGFDEEDQIRRGETIHNNLVKTLAIFDELQSSLDRERGGAFAERMWILYDYMHGEVRRANQRKDDAPIRSVVEMLGGIRQSWSEMLSQWDRTERPAGIVASEIATAA